MKTCTIFSMWRVKSNVVVVNDVSYIIAESGEKSIVWLVQSDRYSCGITSTDSVVKTLAPKKASAVEKLFENPESYYVRRVKTDSIEGEDTIYLGELLSRLLSDRYDIEIYSSAKYIYENGEYKRNGKVLTIDEYNELVNKIKSNGAYLYEQNTDLNFVFEKLKEGDYVMIDYSYHLKEGDYVMIDYSYHWVVAYGYMLLKAEDTGREVKLILTMDPLNHFIGSTKMTNPSYLSFSMLHYLNIAFNSDRAIDVDAIIIKDKNLKQKKKRLLLFEQQNIRTFYELFPASMLRIS